MGRLFLVEFDQTNPEVTFYCCRVCQAHIALSQDCVARMEAIRQGFFLNAVNLVHNELRQVESEIPLEDVHCVKCNKPLGWGYIQLMGPPVVPMFLLMLDVLLFWNGELLRNADELLPPVENQEG